MTIDQINKPRFRIVWTREQLMNGNYAIVNHHHEPLNQEGFDLEKKHNDKYYILLHDLVKPCIPTLYS